MDNGHHCWKLIEKLGKHTLFGSLLWVFDVACFNAVKAGKGVPI